MDKSRMHLLLYTRQILLSNLLFRMGEYEDARIIMGIIAKEEFRAMISRVTANHSIVGLYSFARKEAMHRTS